MTPSQRGDDVLLFGGSFDPVHLGHLIIARAVAEQLGLSQVILIPSARPPHKDASQLTHAAHRLEMCRLAVAGDAMFNVSDWELHQPGRNYTLNTVNHFRAQRPGSRVFWLIGMDSLAELVTWYRVADLVAACTIVTAGRPGRPWPDLSALQALIGADAVVHIRRHVLDTPLVDISATQVRQRVAEGRSIRYLVPDAVGEYIASHGLYRAPIRA
ncbi:MAG: putative nicotinate-nucleotide adenylyltransferase [Phycisphaerae bacterium]|nr:putative nicotinate-nucleotide adenylyltransferase [Phycisphaerae bacterium]